MTQEVVVRSFEWFDSVSAAGDSVKDNGYLIFEVMQKVKSVQTPYLKTPDLIAIKRQYSTRHRSLDPRLHGLIPSVLDMFSASEPAAVPMPAVARTSWHKSSS